MKFKSMDARQRKQPISTSRLEEGDFVIWAEQPEKRTAILTYRAPGVDRPFSASVTTDPTMQDKNGWEGTYWYWNGSQDKPTLKPSLGVGGPGQPYEWHGFLTDGRFEACE